MKTLAEILDRLGMYAHRTTDRDAAGNVEGWRGWLHGRRERGGSHRFTPDEPELAEAKV